MWNILIPTLLTTLFGAGLAWLVGTQVSYVWDERRRRRESDLAALATFYRLYGQFFATWKLWSAHRGHADNLRPPDNTQWSLLERAEEAEGGFESLLVKLASERKLEGDDRLLLGSFREAYQMLREQIRQNQPLNWWASAKRADLGFVQYRAFKALAEYVACLLGDSPKRRLLTPAPAKPDRSQAIAALVAITKRSEFHNSWWTIATDRLHLEDKDAVPLPA
jgi:hypothetical protein